MMESKKEKTISRSPVVVFLGHVDHGKSSILEAIKDWKITSKESGGITQHIGAYQVDHEGKKITFIDTPGHEAFSQMRSRGAKVADIAVLVIDASEGIKKQTKEIISHIKNEELPAIVALNKMDRPEADAEKVKRELSKEGLAVESLGGKFPCVELSAKSGKGIKDLLELILLVAEMEKFESGAEAFFEGVVIESFLDKFRGATATLLIRSGELGEGDIISTSTSFAKIKKLNDFQGKEIKKAKAGDPVLIFGFSKVPVVGEKAGKFLDLEGAKKNLGREKEKEAKESVQGEKVLKLILKTDVWGSAEAIEGMLRNIPQEKVSLKLLKSEPGNINESDLKTAVSGNALVFGFKVKAEQSAKKIAEREKIKIRNFDIIYELVEEVRRLMEKTMGSETVEVSLGKMRVLAKFLADKNRQIIGGRILEGEIKKGFPLAVFREEEEIGRGKIINLQRNKKDTDAVSKGDECGILFEGNVQVEKEDILASMKEEKIVSSL